MALDCQLSVHLQCVNYRAEQSDEAIADAVNILSSTEEFQNEKGLSKKELSHKKEGNG